MSSQSPRMNERGCLEPYAAGSWRRWPTNSPSAAWRPQHCGSQFLDGRSATANSRRFWSAAASSATIRSSSRWAAVCASSSVGSFPDPARSSLQAAHAHLPFWSSHTSQPRAAPTSTNQTVWHRLRKRRRDAHGNLLGTGRPMSVVIKRRRTANAICVEPDRRSGQVVAVEAARWLAALLRSVLKQPVVCRDPLGRGRPRSYKASPRNGNAASAARQLRSSSATPMSPVNRV